MKCERCKKNMTQLYIKEKETFKVTDKWMCFNKECREDSPKQFPVCPKCKNTYYGYPAISRRDGKDICGDCGMAEALEDYLGRQDMLKKKK